MKTAVFWDASSCCLVEIDRRFRGAYCLSHQGDNVGSISGTSVNFTRLHGAVYQNTVIIDIKVVSERPVMGRFLGTKTSIEA
jgi:hypothetical protein